MFTFLSYPRYRNQACCCGFWRLSVWLGRHIVRACAFTRTRCVSMISQRSAGRTNLWQYRVSQHCVYFGRGDSGRPFWLNINRPYRLYRMRGHLRRPPSQLLQSALVDGLSAGSADLQIGTSDTLTSPDYRLKLKLRQFSFTPNGEAVIALDAVIKSRQAEILKTATYSARQPFAVTRPKLRCAPIRTLCNRLLNNYQQILQNCSDAEHRRGKIKRI